MLPAHERLDADDGAGRAGRPWAGSAGPARRGRCASRSSAEQRRAARGCARRASGRRPRTRPRSALAAYIAMSARGSSRSDVVAVLGVQRDARRWPATSRRTPSTTNGSSSAARTRPPSSRGRPARRRIARREHARTRRRRAGRRCRPPQRPSRSRRRDLAQQQVADVVAERVVDLLEVVEVDQQHRDAARRCLGPRRPRVMRSAAGRGSAGRSARRAAPRARAGGQLRAMWIAAGAAAQR